jgi:protein MpaA
VSKPRKSQGRGSAKKSFGPLQFAIGTSGTLVAVAAGFLVLQHLSDRQPASTGEHPLAPSPSSSTVAGVPLDAPASPLTVGSAFPVGPDAASPGPQPSTLHSAPRTHLPGMHPLPSGREIAFHIVGDGPDTALVMGVVHGDEPQGEAMVETLLKDLLTLDPALLAGHRVVLVPVLNPDGLAARTRFNQRGVDLNRNFPAANWKPGPKGRYWGGPRPGSEPETQLCTSLFRKFKPNRILTVHSPYHVINYDGPAAPLAQVMAAANGYPVSADIGYPTPGSLGSYFGKEQRIPTITLEVPPVSSELAVAQNRKALLRFALNAVPQMGRVPAAPVERARVSSVKAALAPAKAVMPASAAVTPVRYPVHIRAGKMGQTPNPKSSPGN